jgi:hypothetical protein
MNRMSRFTSQSFPREAARFVRLLLLGLAPAAFMLVGLGLANLVFASHTAEARRGLTPAVCASIFHDTWCHDRWGQRMLFSNPP